jgi:hypothetical protein
LSQHGLIGQEVQRTKADRSKDAIAPKYSLQRLLAPPSPYLWFEKHDKRR